MHVRECRFQFESIATTNLFHFPNRWSTRSNQCPSELVEDKSSLLVGLGVRDRRHTYRQWDRDWCKIRESPDGCHSVVRAEARQEKHRRSIAGLIKRDLRESIDCRRNGNRWMPLHCPDRWEIHTSMFHREDPTEGKGVQIERCERTIYFHIRDGSGRTSISFISFQNEKIQFPTEVCQ